MNITFTDDELDAIKNLLTRETYRIKRLPPMRSVPKELTVTLKLSSKLVTSANITRVDARILQRLIENYILIARTQTQPELDRRIDEFPGSKERYKPYIEKLDKQLNLMIELSEKIGELL